MGVCLGAIFMPYILSFCENVRLLNDLLCQLRKVVWWDSCNLLPCFAEADMGFGPRVAFDVACLQQYDASQSVQLFFSFTMCSTHG